MGTRTTGLTITTAALGLSLLLFGAIAVAKQPNGHSQDNGMHDGTGPGHGNGNGPGHGNGHGKGLCVVGCLGPRRDCAASARDDHKSCVTMTCAAQRAAVAQTCPQESDTDEGEVDGTDNEDSTGPTPTPAPVTPECQAAVMALHTCLAGCATDFRSARIKCHDDARGCLTNQCGIPAKPTPTPTPVG